MPLYEYECSQCKALTGTEKTLEVKQSHKDPPPICDSCGQTMTKRIVKGSFQLKGSGWAKDGY